MILLCHSIQIYTLQIVTIALPILFFYNLTLPSLVDSQKSDLDSPLTLKEISDSILSMQSGKSPGPDGFPVEFFFKFAKDLSPLMLSMFNESYSSGHLPETLNQAFICLLHKKGKDPLCCQSYRPISLLNLDYKILAKTLARRLENVLPDLVLSDQTGFIRNRHSFSNIQRLFDIIYSPTGSDVPECVISLDAEKAFDRVEWEYLFMALRKFGFGKDFISWVELLYASPLASVNTNNLQSIIFHTI